MTAEPDDHAMVASSMTKGKRVSELLANDVPDNLRSLLDNQLPMVKQ
jgi:hypothetical protein